MNYAGFIFTPSNFWHSSHFSKHNINVFNALYTLSFEDTIGNTSPSISGCILNFDTILTNCYIRERLRGGIKVNFNRGIIRCQDGKDLSYPVFKLF